jgi:hypothetical protein
MHRSASEKVAFTITQKAMKVTSSLVDAGREQSATMLEVDAVAWR